MTTFDVLRLILVARAWLLNIAGEMERHGDEGLAAELRKMETRLYHIGYEFDASHQAPEQEGASGPEGPRAGKE